MRCRGIFSSNSLIGHKLTSCKASHALFKEESNVIPSYGLINNRRWSKNYSGKYWFSFHCVFLRSVQWLFHSFAFLGRFASTVSQYVMNNLGWKEICAFIMGTGMTFQDVYFINNYSQVQHSYIKASCSSFYQTNNLLYVLISAWVHFNLLRKSVHVGIQHHYINIGQYQ